ncbi:hypothetical protein WDU94_011391 [Cyamophila willieti]
MSADKSTAPDLYKELFDILADDETEDRSSGQVELFRNLLREGLNQKIIDVNHSYGDPHYGSMLATACLYRGCGPFIEELLKQGAEPNEINPIFNNGPIHTIVIETKEIEALQLLLKHERTDVNLQDAKGRTALHIACDDKDAENNYEIFKILLNNKDILVNLVDKKGQTAIYLAALREKKDIVLDLLGFKGIDVDSAKTTQGKTARDIILENFPELEANIPDKSADTQEIPKPSLLFYYLHKHDEEAFIYNLNEWKNNPKDMNEIMRSHDGSYTFLQFASYNGFIRSVKLLLDLGADPNGTTTHSERTPIMLASYRGYVDIVDTLYKHELTSFKPIAGETVLNNVIEGIMNVKYSSEEKEKNTDHYACLKYLLEKTAKDKRINVNHKDSKGSTVLHYGARIGEPELILMLLRAGIYIGTRNAFNQPPLQDMPRDVLQKYLDECLQTDKENRRKDDPKYQLVFNYDFLVPPEIETKDDRDSPQESTKRTEGEVNIELEPARGQTAKTGTKLVTVSETAPLLYMSQNEDLRPLLCHPVFTSFVYLKWLSLRKFFFMNLVFFLTYWMLLSFYILYVNRKFTGADETKHVIFRILIGILLTVLIVRELFQILIVSGIRYVKSMDNWVEMSLIFLTGAIVGDCYGIYKHEISAFAILLSWTELALLIARHPSVSTSNEMFKMVTKSFFSFLTWYSIFLFAFGLSFYTMFKDAVSDENQFLNPFGSIFKTLIMSTGEFDSASIPFQDYSPIAQLLFTLFVFSIAMIMINILQGVAVSDTDAILKESKLLANISTIKFICSMENAFIEDSKMVQLYKMLCRLKVSEANLFPDMIPNKFISVYTNDNGKVDFGSGLAGMYIDSEIVKEAKDIINSKNSKSDSTEEKLEALEQTSRRNQEILETILRSLETNRNSSD